MTASGLRCLVAVVALSVCGCDGGGDGSDHSSANPSATPTPAPTVAPTPTALSVNFSRAWAVGSVAVRDDDSDNGIIVRTTDGGATWTTVATSPVDLLAVAFLESGQGLATGRGQILSTDDGGENWTISRQVSGETLADVTILDSGRAIAVGSGPMESPPDLSGPIRILTTDDGGSTWREANIPPSVSTLHITLRFVCVNTDQTGVTFGQGPNGTAILRTRDGGQTWTDVSDRVESGDLIGGTCLGNQSFALVGNGTRLVESFDGGDTWQDRSSVFAMVFPASGELHDLTLAGQEVGWAVGARYEILDDGATRAIPAIVRTADGGQNWEQATVPFDLTNEQRNGGLFGTARHGASGLAVGQDDATGAVNPNRLSPLALVTRDGGSTWNPVTVPDEVGLLNDVAVQP